MPSAVSTKDFRKVTPAWLRPAAAAFAAFVHFLVLVGIPWPYKSDLHIARPIELQVIPQGGVAEAIVPVDTQQAAEVRPSDVTPSAPAAETQLVAATETNTSAHPPIGTSVKFRLNHCAMPARTCTSRSWFRGTSE
jgi:hypothetical protein